MTLRAKCPNCQYTFALHERALGRKLACPRCEQEIRVPTKEDVQAARANQAAKSRPAVSIAPKQPTLQARAVSPLPSSSQTSPAVLPETEVRPTRKRKKVKREINHDEAWDITPMVDVAFLLLIFFMVTNSFSIQKVIRTARQANEQASATPMQTEVQDKTNFVTVQVHEQDGFSVVFPDGSQEDAFSKQDLILALNRAKEEGGEDLNTLSVEAHEESTHGAVVSALDAGRAANFLTFRTTVVEQFQ